MPVPFARSSRPCGAMGNGAFGQVVATYVPQLGDLRAALKRSVLEQRRCVRRYRADHWAVPLWSQSCSSTSFADGSERAFQAAALRPDQNRPANAAAWAALGGLQSNAISSVRKANDAWGAALAIAVELGETDYQFRAISCSLGGSNQSRRVPNRHFLFAQRFAALSASTESALNQIVADRFDRHRLAFLGRAAAGAGSDRANGHPVRRLGRPLAPRPLRSSTRRLPPGPFASDPLAPGADSQRARRHRGTMSRRPCRSITRCRSAKCCARRRVRSRFWQGRKLSRAAISRCWRERTAPRPLDVFDTFADVSRPRWRLSRCRRGRTSASCNRRCRNSVGAASGTLSRSF